MQKLFRYVASRGIIPHFLAGTFLLPLVSVTLADLSLLEDDLK